MNIRICGLDELSTVINEFNPTHVLSLIREGVAQMVCEDIVSPHKEIKHHIENFDDVDSLDKAYYESDNQSNVKLTFVNVDNIKRIINWLESYDVNSDSLIIHCQAGISRSTAMAFGILVFFSDRTEQDIINSFKYVTKIRPYHFMNTLILKCWDEVLGDTDLQSVNKKWNRLMDDEILTKGVIKEKINFI